MIKTPPLKGWYYVRAWAKSSPLIAHGKSHDGSWKDSWFFALGDWELRNSPDMCPRYQVQTHFSTLGSFIIIAT